MPTALDLLQSALRFYRSHPLLNQVVLWLLVLPSFAASVLQRLGGLANAAPYWRGYIAADGADTLAVLGILILHVVVLWGTAAVIVVGRRMLQSNAGRSRTSFRAVRQQSAAVLVPLLLTDILRACITLLWTLLLIIPGVIYSTRTAVAGIVVVCEGLAYRDALNRSRRLVEGRTLNVFLLLVGLAVILALPVALFGAFLEAAVGAFDPRLLAVADAIEAGLAGLTACLYTLSLIALYGGLVETAADRD